MAWTSKRRKRRHRAWRCEKRWRRQWLVINGGVALSAAASAAMAKHLNAKIINVAKIGWISRREKAKKKQAHGARISGSEKHAENKRKQAATNAGIKTISLAPAAAAAAKTRKWHRAAYENGGKASSGRWRHLKQSGGGAVARSACLPRHLLGINGGGVAASEEKCESRRIASWYGARKISWRNRRQYQLWRHRRLAKWRNRRGESGVAKTITLGLPMARAAPCSRHRSNSRASANAAHQRQNSRRKQKHQCSKYA